MRMHPGWRVAPGLAAWQWQPTLRFHRPRPPITIKGAEESFPVVAVEDLAEISAEVYPVLELQLPGQTFRLTSEGHPLNSDSLGAYEGRVEGDWPEVVYRIDRNALALGLIEISVTIRDLSANLVKVLQGSEERYVKGSAASLKWSCAGTWKTLFVGRVANVQGAGALSWRLTLRSADDLLQTNRVPWLAFNGFDFPNAPDPAIFGKPIPIPYGINDSKDGTLVGAKGACPAYYANAVAGARYAICSIGDLFHVERVFVNDAILSGSNWSRSTLLIGGGTFIELSFNPAIQQPHMRGKVVSALKLVNDPGNTARITWDGIGLFDVRAGSAGYVPPLTNPADQMRNLLNNFVLPETPWTSGVWAGDHALIDTDSWDTLRAQMETRSMRGGMLIADFTDGLTLLNAWCERHGVAPFWTRAGQLGVRLIDPSRSEVYFDSRWIRAYESEDSAIVRQEDEGAIESELSSDAYLIHDGARGLHVVRDPRVARVTKHLAGTWGARSPRPDFTFFDSPTFIGAADQLEPIETALLFDGSGIQTFSDTHGVVGATQRDFVQGTAGKRPTLKIGACGRAVRGALPALVFDGVDDEYNSGGFILSDFIDATFHHVVVVLKATGPGGAFSDSEPYNNPAILSNANSSWGLSQRKDSNGQNWLQGWLQESGGRKVATVPINVDQWYVVSFSHQNTHVYLSAGSLFAGDAQPCGAGSDLGGTVYIGRNGSGTVWWKGEIYMLYVSNNDPSNQGGGPSNHPGGWVYQVCEGMADLLRLPNDRWRGV